MAQTSGSGSGGGTGWFGTILSDATSVAQSWAAAKATDVQPATLQTVPGIENGYYGYGTAPAASSGGSPSLVTIAAIVGLGLLGFFALRHLR